VYAKNNNNFFCASAEAKKQRNLRKISKKELKTVLMTFENPSHNGRVSFGASITYALFA
jgi:ornithine carbamoyltransferase